MGAPRAFARPGENRLLAALPREAYRRLLPHLEPVALAWKQGLYEPGRPIPHAYFPLRGFVSLVVGTADEAGVEVTAVGNEGMVGLPVFLGAGTAPHRALCQIPGEALRLPADALRAQAAGGGPLHELLQRYAQALFNQAAQTAACNRLHTLDRRCARWLLMSHDRVGADRFPLTQEFLGQMLGVRRATVSAAAGALQREGLIRYRRGLIAIVDRAGLEAAACGCYRIARDEFDRLLPEAP